MKSRGRKFETWEFRVGPERVKVECRTESQHPGNKIKRGEVSTDDAGAAGATAAR